VARSLRISFSFLSHLWLIRRALTRSGSGADPSPEPQQASAAGFGMACRCASGISVAQKKSTYRRNLDKDRAQARAPAVHEEFVLIKAQGLKPGLWDQIRHE